jgi:hypothetical protein
MDINSCRLINLSNIKYGKNTDESQLELTAIFQEINIGVIPGRRLKDGLTKEKAK